jgi:hypothetical protein
MPMRRLHIKLLLAAGLAAASTLSAAAQSCTADDFARAVDGAGSSLREFNAQNAPKLQEKLRQLKVKRGWSETEFEERSIDLLHDARVEELDRRANDILGRIDELGATTQGAPDCDKLPDLQAASLELLATMRAKSSYMLGRIDAMLEDRPATAAAPATAPATGAAPAAKAQPKAASPPPTPPAARTPGRPADVPSQWSTITSSEQQTAAVIPPATEAPLAGLAPSEDGYTIEEIREATRGFFGQVSTGLASVIEHAFKRGGRPTAYVLGTEGGGAFLAGLRYGDGTVFFRSGGSSRIYWHGPSIGYDFGAAGSRTMFLIYNLKNRDDLFRRFSGVDGSAYLVGGVGITFLTNGQVVMAPIRSGLGLRLGASIGYVRFTPTQTWNPF